MVESTDGGDKPQLPEWTIASLRIYTSKRSSREITTILETLPTYSHEVGDPVNPSKTNGQRHTKSMWLLRPKVTEQAPLPIHLSKLLDFMEGKQTELLILKEDCTVDIVLGYSAGSGQGGFDLDHSLLRRVADAGIDLAFNIYVPSVYNTELLTPGE